MISCFFCIVDLPGCPLGSGHTLNTILSTRVHGPCVLHNRTLHIGGAGGGCTWYFVRSLSDGTTINPSDRLAKQILGGQAEREPVDPVEPGLVMQILGVDCSTVGMLYP